MKAKILVSMAVISLMGMAAMAAPPEAPKVSTFAPADDLVVQLEKYVDSLQESVANEADYKDAQGKVSKESNALILIALALGVHDSDNPYKASAASIIKAAKDVAATKDFASAKKAIDALKAAVAAKAAGGEVKWEKMADLDELMKQVPAINTSMKSKMKRFSKSSKDVASLAAILAVISQGAMYDTSETKNEAQVKQWYDFSVQARDAAAAVNKAAHAKDQAAAEKANEALGKICDDCHAVFKPDVKK